MIGNRRRNHRFFQQWNALEERSLLAAPVIAPIAPAQIPSGKTLMVPISATDADGDPITYSVSSNSTDPNAVVKVRSGHPFMKISVANYGDMVFQLFDDIAPNTVSTITSLVNQKFYDGLTFHRMIKDFMIQGGDPSGNGSGGPGFKFADEFSPEAIFSGYGQLAMANSGKDTNGSQFFITTTQTRFLDFNHTIWGQIVKGFDVLAALNVASAPVTISSVSMVTNTTDSVLYLKMSGTSPVQVSLTAQDPSGAADTKTFTVTPIADTTNDPPILGPLNNLVSYTNKVINIPLSSFDYENDEVTYGAAFGINPAPGTFTINNGTLSLTPANNYKGNFLFRIGVRQTNASNRGSTSDPWDIQDINIRIDDPFQTTSKSVTVVEGQKLTSTVLGSFVPLVPKDVSKYNVQIELGDGQTVAGVVNVNAQGGYEITSNGAFQRFGNYTVKITVTDTVDNVSTVINSTGIVNDAPISATFVDPVRQPGSGLINAVIATITDANPTSVPADFTAKINWGDSSTNDGIIQLLNGSLVVVGSKTYNTLGTYSINVNITSSGGKTAAASGSIVVANATPVITPVANQSVSEKESLSFNVVATDSDAWQKLTYSLSASAPAGVTIDSTGKVSVPAGITPGSYNFNVSVQDDGVPSRSASSPVSLTVSDAPISAFFVDPVRQPGSGQIDAIIATISDTNPAGKATDLTAQILWGDGTTSLGTIQSAASGFVVRGLKSYSAEGNFNIDVKVTSKYGSLSTASGSISVANNSPVITPIQPLTTMESVPLSFNIVASDADGWQTLTYKLGANTPAGVNINSQTGKVDISGLVAPGTYNLNLIVSDNGTPSKTAESSVQLTVKAMNRAPVISFSNNPASVFRGAAFAISGQIVDKDSAPLANATIDIGDGSGPQPLSTDTNGNFSVNKLYNSVGSFTVKVTAVDTEGLSSANSFSVQVVNPFAKPLSVVAQRTRTGQITAIQIVFDSDLNAASANRLTGYSLINPGRDRKFGTRDDLRIALRSAVYDAARRTITIRPRANITIPAGVTFQLQAAGLADSALRPVDGDRNGSAGGNLVVNLTRTTAALA